MGNFLFGYLTYWWYVYTRIAHTCMSFFGLKSYILISSNDWKYIYANNFHHVHLCYDISIFNAYTYELDSYETVFL